MSRNPVAAPGEHDPASALQQALFEGIRNGRWQAGQRLPTERELAQDYGVGRAVVRRVLARLRDAGLIRQVVGSGTFVREAALPDAGEAAPLPVSPADLMAARLRLEPMLAEMAVSHGTPTDFEAMDECCRRAETATTLAEFEHWDAALHQRIAEATRNGFFVAIFELVNAVRTRDEWGMLKRRSMSVQRRERYHREHRELVAALKARDAVQARARMLAHLQGVADNMFGA